VWNENRIKILNLEIEKLKSILSSNKLKNGSQQTVWQVIHDWVIANEDDRLKHLPKLLKKNLQYIRLNRKFVEESIFNNIIFTHLPTHFRTDIKNLVINELDNRNYEKTNWFSFFGSFQKLICINKKSGYLEVYNQSHNNWYSSSLLLQPIAKYHFFEFALLGSTLYAFGGQHGNNNTAKLLWSRFLNDPSSQWKAMADMTQSKRAFSSVFFNGTIYILGGWGKEGNSSFRVLCSCERYDYQLNQWSTVKDMKIGRTDASATVINGFIYIAGGWSGGGTIEQSVAKYCPKTDTWSEVASMTTARYHFALTFFAGRLWAIGGLGGDNLQLLCSCESYDLVTNTWREEAPLNEGRCGHAAIEFNGDCMVVGGEKMTDTWREEAPMKEERWGHAAIEFNGELYVVGGGNNVKIDKWLILVCTCHITSFDYYSTWKSKSLNFDVQVAWVMKN
ncbi:hypothetical protein TYRP_017565, partial [Tyrophagus putrescentiae]